MASSYSATLGLELMATGEDAGTWGTKTNTNLSPLIESAVCGRATANFGSDANLTISITNGTDSTGRYYIINATSSGSLTATRDLICPLNAGKTYVVYNNTTGGQSIRVIGSSGTGITIPTGKTGFVYNDGTNYKQMIDWMTGVTMVAPVLGVATGTSLALGGATLGSHSLAVSRTGLADCITVNGTLTGADLFAHAYEDDTAFSSTSTGAYASYDTLCAMSGALAYDHFYGYEARQFYAGSTSVGVIAGFVSHPTVTGPGTVSGLYHFYALDGGGAGAIGGAQVGLDLPDLTRGTQNYGIYSAISSGANKYFINHVGTAISAFGGSISGTALNLSSLTAGRVTYAGTSGLLSDDSGFTYNSGTHALTTTTFVGALTGNATTASGVAVGGITGLGTGVATWLATPSSANLASALTTKTGTGNAVFSASPTLTGTLTAAIANFSGAVTASTTLGVGGAILQVITGTEIFSVLGEAALKSSSDFGWGIWTNGAGATTTATYVRFYNTSGATITGSITTAASATLYNTTSDERLKDWSIPQQDYRAAIQSLWIGDYDKWGSFEHVGDPTRNFGVRAQQAYEIFGPILGIQKPDNSDDTWMASSEPFGFMALWGVKDQYNIIAELEARLAALEKKMGL